MEQRYLVDTNIIIDFTSGRLPEEAKDLLATLKAEQLFTSIIVKIEALGFEALPPAMLLLQEFVHNLTVLPLTNRIAEKTILLRKINRIKLPDAIIAATALVHHLTLITRNTADFKKIEDLLLLDTWEM